MSLRYLTAGESHGEMLTGILEGMPAGLSLDSSRDIDPYLKLRQQGHGRGRRQRIEDDRAVITSGVRFGTTLGSPIAITIANRDWKNWSDRMSIVGEQQGPQVQIARPGHADLAGAIKYEQSNDLRNILERASARETAIRCALGAVALRLLDEVGVNHGSVVHSIGGVRAVDGRRNQDVSVSVVRTFDQTAEAEMIAAIDRAAEDGDTLGGVVECSFEYLPVGIGSHVQWDRKLDGILAQAVMSIQAVKAVEIGDGIAVSAERGSRSHDEFEPQSEAFVRKTNRAGGIEGGMTNGEPVVVRAYMKPLSTLMQPLQSFNLITHESANAHIERSDVCAVPALSIILECVVGLAIAGAVLDAFPSDTIAQLRTQLTHRRNTTKTMMQA